MTSLLHFADIHFGVEDRDALAKLDATIKRLAPDVSVISGDITQTGSEEEFAAAARWIATLAGPKVITPGNHDTPMYGLVDRVFRPFERYERYIAPLDTGRYEDDQIVILSLNTARGWQMSLDWSLGVIGLEDLDQRIEDFSKADPEKLRLLNVHHPFLYPPESPLQKTTRNGPEGLTRLSDAGCDMILSGHIHVPFAIERQPGSGTLLSISAGTLSTRRRKNHPAFNHIEVTDEAVVITMIEFDGEGFVDAERFRASRQSLRAPKGPSTEKTRQRGKVLATQPLRPSQE